VTRRRERGRSGVERDQVEIPQRGVGRPALQHANRLGLLRAAPARRRIASTARAARVEPLSLGARFSATIDRVSEADCPKCQLPKDDGAWHCDGCGHEFSQDYEAVRSRLRAELARCKRTLVVTGLVGAVVVGIVIYLATRRFFYISVPLGLAVFGSVGHALHRISVMRGHVRSFERRRPPLPAATVHRDRT
jgi:hypothetical protein